MDATKNQWYEIEIFYLTNAQMYEYAVNYYQFRGTHNIKMCIAMSEETFDTITDAEAHAEAVMKEIKKEHTKVTEDEN